MPEHRTDKTVGPVSAVPCPWCGRTNDCRGIQESHLLEKGNIIDCDHCKRKSVIEAVDTRPRVVLKQYHG
jgi:hypothetical protein